MARCLVTGGSGFIGSHIVEALLARNYEVRVLDNFSTGDRTNLLSVAGSIEVIEGDLRSFERVLTAAQGCDIIFHEGALPSVPRSIRDPLTTDATNVGGTLNVLLAARAANCKRVVFASSSSVYGSIPVEVKSEELPVAPLSPYGVSKYAGEAYCSAFFEVYGLETVALRYFNVFGPRQSPVSEYAAVIPNFFAAAMLNEEATIFGDGEQARDFTYIDNVVEANLLAAETTAAAGEVFNIACGEKHTVNGLLEAVASATDTPIPATHQPSRKGDVRISVADVSKAERILGFKPTVDLKEGLQRTYSYFEENRSTILPQIHEQRSTIALTN